MSHRCLWPFLIKLFLMEGNIMSENEDETLKRDKEILTHIQHRYDEEERRFQTVDSKISYMIAVLIMIFTTMTILPVLVFIIV